LYNDKALFELLILELFQAGLSWITILKKRENFRKTFDDFNHKKMSMYNEKKIQALLNDAGIIRNRKKIEAAIIIAKDFDKVKKEYKSFSSFIWQFAPKKKIKSNYKRLKDLPVISKESETMSKEFKKRGYTFLGPVTCYAFMQAAGLVDDHMVGCFKKIKKD